MKGKNLQILKVNVMLLRTKYLTNNYPNIPLPEATTISKSIKAFNIFRLLQNVVLH